MTGAQALKRAGISPERAARIEARVVRDDVSVVLVRHGLAHQDWPPRLVDLHRRGTITRAMAESGRDFWRDWKRSGLDPSASRPGDVRADGGGGYGCGPRFAEYIAATRALGDYLSIVHAVCCWDVGLREWWRLNRHVPKHAVPVLLRGGLELLCRHYA